VEDPNRPPVEDPNRPPVEDPNRPPVEDPNRPPAPDPNRPPPEPERPPPEPERPPPARDPWADVQARHPELTDAQVGRLRDLGVDPEAVGRCLDRGVAADSLVARAEQGGPRAIRIIDSLLAGRRAQRVEPRSAERVAELASTLDATHPGRGIFDSVETLSTSGRLRNPASLRALLEDIAAGDTNKIVELTMGAERARAGNEVQLGVINRVGADVVDHTAQEAIQIKNVTSPDEGAVGENLTAAANQLAGRGARGRLRPGDRDTEVPPQRPDGTPYTRVAELFVRDPNNPLFNADRATIEAFVRDTLSSATNRTAVDRVVIHNNHPSSPHVINGPF
jgi:hypothetical protein